MRSMVQFIKKYWIECLVFSIIAFVVINDLLPNWTWINTDSDGVHYTMAAKYMWIAHNTSAPLFLLLGRLFLFIPFGSEAWRFGLILALSTIIASIVIYKIVRYHLKDNPKQRLYALISSIIYGGSALVISQSTIIDTYAFDTMLALFAYYLAIRKQWVFSGMMVGLLWATHTLFAWMTWIPLLIFFKPMRDRVVVLIALLGFLFYLYVPIVVLFNHPSDMWNNTTLKGFFMGTSGVLTMLTGTIAIYDIPKRVIDAILIVAVSLGFGTVILLWSILTKKISKIFLWLIAIPFIYFITNLSSETYVYLMPTIAFGAIAIGISLSFLKLRWSYITVSLSVALLAFNANYFDIGRTLDKNLSAMEFYNVELAKIPDGQIFLGGGWNWAMVYMYNKENNRHIIPISTDTLPSNDYLSEIEAQGIKLVRSNKVNDIDRQYEVALSIAELNNGVWIVRDTDPRTYGAELVLAKSNEELLTQWLYHTTIPSWRVKPSNPYDFITGAIEVSDWKFVLRSNKNANFAVGLGIIIYSLYWLVMKQFDKRKAIYAKA